MFDVLSYKQRFDANKVKLTNNGYPYIVRQSTDNGQKGFILENKKWLNEGNTISFGQDTATVFYQEKPYFTGDKIKILKPKDKRFCKHNAQFFLAAIRRAFGGFSWGTQSYSTKVIEDTNILLPQTFEEDINFKFIENLLRELERARLRELEAYLVATGLSNYQLSSADKKALSDFRNLQWKEFRIGDLYSKVEFTKKKFNKKSDTSSSPSAEYSLPIINAKHGDNGIMFYGKESVFPSEEMTIDIVQNGAIATGDVYPQPQRTGVLWDAYLIKAKKHIDSRLSLFFFTCTIWKSIKPKFSYEFKATWDRVKNENIYLPVTTDGKTPDFAAMEQIVAAVQKIVIADVAKYTARNLEATQQVIEAQDEPQIEQTITPLITEPKENEKYISLLPVYSLRAACGYFGDGEEVEELGWMQVEGMGRLNKDMFVVQAVGQSMEPRIHNGDYCVFEKYSGGSRQGKIVLAQHRGYFDEDNAGAYSIKEYSSEKSYNDDGSWQHESITLRPFNPEYEPIRIDAEDAESFAIIGEFVGVVTL